MRNIQDILSNTYFIFSEWLPVMLIREEKGEREGGREGAERGRKRDGEGEVYMYMAEKIPSPF